MAKKVLDATVFGRLLFVAVSKDWTGFDGGLFQLKVISHPERQDLKAVRVVLYRIVFWISLQKVRN